MKIEWWMLDGLVGLILLITIIRGIAKGIGDAVLRLIGLGGGLVLGVMYSEKVSGWLYSTRISRVLHDNIYELLRPGAEEAALENAGDSGRSVIDMVTPSSPDGISSALPKTISGLFSSAADRTAEAAANSLTAIAISILSFLIIMLAIWLVMLIIRLIFKHFRKESFVIGFVDRLLGMVLGIVRGTVIACIVIAALIPVVTIFAPEKVPEIISAMKDTYVAGIIYDINPLMLLIKYAIG